MSYSTLLPTALNRFDTNHDPRLLFGPGMLNELHNYPMPGKKALIVLDKDPYAKTCGYLARLEEQLKLAGCESAVYDQIQPNPTLSSVMDGVKCCLENDCDFIVALGGGSVIDSSKAISVSVSNGGNYWDYVMGGSGGSKPVLKNTCPVIAITTTAGTGSEMGMGIVITNEKTNEKGSLKSPFVYAHYAVTDPELHVSVPPRQSAFQGFDAFAHCVEGYISLRGTLMTDTLALAAIENVVANLPKVVRNGNDIEARTRVAFGASMSGTTMAITGTSSLHAIEHAMSAYHEKLPHGAGLIICNHAYHERNIDVHACDDRYIEMARAMGKKDADKPEDFLEMLDKFIELIDCDDLRMSDYGITPDEFEKFDENARFTTGGLFLVDRVPFTKEDVINLYQKSYK